jgi:hypothetical protein
MPITIKVNGTTNSLIHKGSNGISTATLPDVCKTPTPGGPAPLPYPNISQSATLAKGTTTVKADSGMMIAIKGSEFSMSNGDEPGPLGGVSSSTFIKESTWILYSPDVKMEGLNACRLSDKKFQNHENTADLAGTIQVPIMPNATPLQFLQEIACRCDKKKDNNYVKDSKPRQPLACSKAGIEKHSCCDDAISKHQKSERPPKVGGEKGYDASCKELPPPGRAERFLQGSIPKGSMWPDAAALGADEKPTRLFDFKFKCKHPKHPEKQYAGVPKWGHKNLQKQYLDYKRLSRKLGIDPNKNPPKIIHNANC